MPGPQPNLTNIDYWRYNIADLLGGSDPTHPCNTPVALGNLRNIDLFSEQLPDRVLTELAGVVQALVQHCRDRSLWRSQCDELLVACGRGCQKGEPQLPQQARVRRRGKSRQERLLQRVPTTQKHVVSLLGDLFL
jgi:hypothetical protein